ncbi:peptidoglycan-binding domain-containing protein [Streptomyces asoensis]|uniref:peptidoglycan-binding domain-containing protein n=1 Tax=Streptomyces asoensis TaxID=249586 RepID=UPI0033DA0B36
MSEPQGDVCPLCGARRADDGTPACVCARLASDAHRSARTAEAAAAEDFDPVRIRPFVVLGDSNGEGERGGGGDGVPGDGNALSGPARPVPTPSEGPGGPPSAQDTAADSGEAGSGEPPPRRGPARRVRLLLLAGVLVAAVTAAVLTGFLLYDAPAREGVRPQGVRAPVPEETSGSPAATRTGTPSTAASRTPRPSPSASRTHAPPSTAPAVPSRSAVPAPAPSADASATTSPGPGATESAPSVLRLGDTGPEVAELQSRLRQSGFYTGPDSGTYDRQVETAVRSYQLARVVLQDESGVYGAATRAALEAETDEP